MLARLACRAAAPRDARAATHKRSAAAGGLPARGRPRVHPPPPRKPNAADFARAQTAVDALLHAAAADGDGSSLLDRCIADVSSLGAELNLDRVGPAAWNSGTFQGHALQGDLRRVLSAPLTLPALSFGLFSAPPGELTLLPGAPSRIIKGASGRSRQPRAAGRDPDSRPDRYAVQTPFLLRRAGGNKSPLRGVNTAVGSFSVGWADDAPRELHVAFSHVRLELTRADDDSAADDAEDAALLGMRERELPEPACATLRVLLMTPTVAVTRSDAGNVAVLTRCDAV